MGTFALSKGTNFPSNQTNFERENFTANDEKSSVINLLPRASSQSTIPILTNIHLLETSYQLPL